MAQIRVPRRIGRPRLTPDVVLADRAYSSRAIRRHLRRRGIRGCAGLDSAASGTAGAAAHTLKPAAPAATSPGRPC